MIFGLIMLVVALYMWFLMPKAAEEKSATAFVKVWKSLFGAKGYIITVRILAVFCFIVALRELYGYFFGVE